MYYNFAPRTTDLWNLSRTTQADASQFQRITLNHFETITFRSTLNARCCSRPASDNMTRGLDARGQSATRSTSLRYPVTEQTTGVNFRAYNATFSDNITAVRSYRVVDLVRPGSHAFKFGFNLSEGPGRTAHLDEPTTRRSRSGTRRRSR